MPFADVEPYPEPIDPAILLSDLVDIVRQFIVVDEHQATASALWVAMTWFTGVVKYAPLLIITAPEHECGKSQLRDLLAKIVLRPLSTNNIKSATLFRIAGKWHPTLMLDEVDLMVKQDRGIFNLINAGHHRGASQVWRLVGKNHEPEAFDVWGAKCFAGINLELLFPPSTMSRAIVFKMRRRLAHESVSSLCHAPDSLFNGIASKLARFMADYSALVRQARPTIPEALGDRARNNWEPLLAIASCAGPEWLKKAKDAALSLSGAGERTVSRGNELLAHIRQVFANKKISWISTGNLITALCEDDEYAWATFNRGGPISARQIADLLAGYGIRSQQKRLGNHNPVRGFELSQFSEAFARYLPNQPELPLQPLPLPEANKHSGFAATGAIGATNAQPTTVTPKHTPILSCNTVTDKAAPQDRSDEPRLPFDQRMCFDHPKSTNIGRAVCDDDMFELRIVASNTVE